MESRTPDYVSPYQGDVYQGHLSTPISDSALVRAFINNLPAYRAGLSPWSRGLEVGMAHGYFVVGPWTALGPLRDSEGLAALGGLIAGVGLILIATATLSAYGLVSFPKDQSPAAYAENNSTPMPDDMKTAGGWSQYTGGFFLGAMGGAFVAYLLVENFSVLDAMLRGIVN